MEIKGNDDNEQIARLVRDNRALREQLTTACNKLERIQITLRSLSESMLSHVSHGSASDLPTPDETSHKVASDRGDEGPTTGKRTRMLTRRQAMAAGETTPSNTDQCDDEVLGLQSNINEEQLLPSILLDTLPTDGDHGLEQSSLTLHSNIQGRQTPVDLDMSRFLGSFSDVRGLPGIWTHEYQMGPASFRAHSPSVDKITGGLANTNSSFSDHMQMIKACLKVQWRKATHIRTEVDTLQVIFPTDFSHEVIN